MCSIYNGRYLGWIEYSGVVGVVDRVRKKARGENPHQLGAGVTAVPVTSICPTRLGKLCRHQGRRWADQVTHLPTSKGGFKERLCHRTTCLDLCDEPLNLKAETSSVQHISRWSDIKEFTAASRMKCLKCLQNNKLYQQMRRRQLCVLLPSCSSTLHL